MPATPSHVGLTAELAFGAHFAGHAGHFRGERAELIDHRVDRVLQLEDFALHVDRDLLGQVAVGDGGGHVGDVAHLAGQVAGHAVDGVGQVLPRAGDALHLGLAAELAFGAHFAGHAGHFRGERAELIDHRVDRLGGAQELALQRAVVDFQGHRLRQIALGHGADHAGRFAGRMDQVVDQLVDRLDRLVPEAADVAQRQPLAELAFLADDAAEAAEFAGHPLVQLDDVVEGVGHFAGHAGPVDAAAGRRACLAASAVRASSRSVSSVVLRDDSCRTGMGRFLSCE